MRRRLVCAVGYNFLHFIYDNIYVSIYINDSLPVPSFASDVTIFLTPKRDIETNIEGWNTLVHVVV